jgi:hypothetical protein
MRGGVTPHTIKWITSRNLSSHFTFRLLYTRAIFFVTLRTEGLMRLTSDKSLSMEENYICHIGNHPHSCYLVQSLCRLNWAGSFNIFAILISTYINLNACFLGNPFYIRSVRLSICLSSWYWTGSIPRTDHGFSNNFDNGIFKLNFSSQ